MIPICTPTAGQTLSTSIEVRASLSGRYDNNINLFEL